MKMTYLLFFILVLGLTACTTATVVSPEPATVTLADSRVEVVEQLPTRAYMVDLAEVESVFIPRHIDAVVEFHNSLDTRERFSIPTFGVDVLLRPNERVTVNLENTQPGSYEYVFANNLRQIVVN